MKLSEAVRLLKTSGIDEARQEARLIFSKIGNVPGYELLFDPESDCVKVSEAITERCKRVPLAYIIGEVDFYRESYKVTKDCLIPRPETELLVDFAIESLTTGDRFLDLCTGSGCIAISTLKNTENTTAIAVDISEKAISLAKENAEKNGVQDRVNFITGDVFSGVSGEFSAILSNPPYVSDNAYLSLEPEIYEEPKIAFVGGADGGDFYRKIIPIYKKNLKEGGFFAFEIGFDQGELLLSLAEKNGMTAEIIKDYSSLDRIAVLKKK